jgi:hypothetical protein
MDEEATLSMDSFVDIVANTLGIFILLALVAIITAHGTGIKLNVELGHLLGLREGNKATRSDLERLAGEIEHLGTEVARKKTELKGSLVGLGYSTARFAKEPGFLAEELGRARGEAEGLEGRLATLGAEDKRLAREKSDAEAAVVSRFTQTEIESVRGMVLKDMLSALAAAEAAQAKLLAESTSLEDERARLAREAEAMRKEIGELEANRHGVVEIREPLWSAGLSEEAVFVECYVPEKALDPDGARRPAVRLLGRAFAKEGGKLKALSEGESTFRIQDAGSAYRSFLGDPSERSSGSRGGRYLRFLVRPDAYGAFRLARKLARDSGWRVDWEPKPAGLRPAGAGSSARASDRFKNPSGGTGG